MSTKISDAAVFQCPRCSTSMEVDPSAKPSPALNELCGDERARFEAWIQGTRGWKKCARPGKRAPMSLRTRPDGSYDDYRVNDRWNAWQAALAATGKQPLQVGEVQGDGLPVRTAYAIATSWREQASRLKVGRATLIRCAAELEAALAARQPVGQEPVARIDDYVSAVCAAINCRLRELDWDVADEDLHDAVEIAVRTTPIPAPPAQDIDLPYSLDADTAGIRARVADVITGTLMVGAQGHTPPPAGHWAEPFWQMARADAATQGIDLGQPSPSVTRHRIEDAPGLDPITVYVENYEPGKGRMVVTCYASAWTAFWGAMGDDTTLEQFVASCSPEYVADNMVWGADAKKSTKSHADKVAAAVVALFKSQRDAATLATVRPPRDLRTQLGEVG